MGPKSGHHAVTQSGEELFNCTQCTYSFATRAHLKVHMSTHSKHRKSISSEISATINHNHGRAKTFQLALPPCHQFVAIWEKVTFFFERLFLVVPRTWLEYRSVFFWAQNLGFFGQKIRFLPYDPKFGQRPVCSLWRGHSFPTLGTIFRLSVPELQQFS